MNFAELNAEINEKTVVVINRDSVGTGFIIDKRGYIATAEHVVTGNDDVEVITILSNPNTIPAKVVKRDQQLDIALLKIKENDRLSVVELGDSSSVNVGDEIVIVGFPFGNYMWGTFIPAIHRGIISCIIKLVNQPDGKITNRFQLDVMANRGNSGSPLALNKNGKIVGILTNVFVEKPVGDVITIGGRPITSPTGIAIATPIEHLKEMMANIQE